MTAPTQEYFNRSEVVAIAHERGLRHITENSVICAAYYGNRPLKKTKFGGRIYYTRKAIDAWLDTKAAR